MLNLFRFVIRDVLIYDKKLHYKVLPRYQWLEAND